MAASQIRRLNAEAKADQTFLDALRNTPHLSEITVSFISAESNALI